MLKIGNIVVCKSFLKNVNGVIRNYDPNITIGKSYIIVDMAVDMIEINKYGVTNLRMLQILGERGKCWYWSDYFYNIEELRKMKIEKLKILLNE